MKRLVVGVAALALLVEVPSATWAGKRRHSACGGVGPGYAMAFAGSCAPQMQYQVTYQQVQRIVYTQVPVTTEQEVTEMVCVPVTRNVPQQQTVYVQRTRNVQQQVTTYRTELQTQQQQQTVCVPVTQNVQQQYTVCVPVTTMQTRQVTEVVPQTQMVTRQVPVTTMQ